MFRRAFASAGRLAVGVGAVQFGAAAAVALTDKQLDKKPEWYAKAVRSLEHAFKTTGKYGYIESESILNETEEVLNKVHDIHNTEIQWRIARVYAEKAELTKCPEAKQHLLHKAQAHAKQALASEPGKGSSGAHKWYGIILSKLQKFEPKHDFSEEILNHFHKAASIDAQDPYAFHLLGVAQYKKKDYKAAIESFKKAEAIRENFSAANHYYLGLALKDSGNKQEGIKSLKQTFHIIHRCAADGKARSEASHVLLMLGLKAEEFEVDDL